MLFLTYQGLVAESPLEPPRDSKGDVLHVGLEL